MKADQDTILASFLQENDVKSKTDDMWLLSTEDRRHLKKTGAWAGLCVLAGVGLCLQATCY